VLTGGVTFSIFSVWVPGDGNGLTIDKKQSLEEVKEKKSGRDRERVD